MRFCSLASSSKAGSAYFIEGGDGTRVLVDCGLGIRKLEAELRAVGVDPATLAGVMVTHDHWDHVAALRLRHPFTAKHRVPLWATEPLVRSLLPTEDGRRDLGSVRRIAAGKVFQVGGLEVTAFAKPHDAPDPLGFILDDGECRAAVVTDLGVVTRAIAGLLRDSTYLIFESNHDVEMELNSGRPVHLIRRVLGDHGHLSNDQAAEALAEIAGPRTRMILLAHLSDECNTPELALGAVGRALDDAGYSGGLAVAPMFERSCLFSEEHTPRLPCQAVAE